MLKIDFYQEVEGKTRAVFVILYALDGKPWQNYTSKPERSDLVIPTFIMINRADGRIGFVGGKVDPGESLEEAARRETLEEIGYQLNHPLEPLVAHDLDTFSTHVFASELSYEQLKQIQRDAHQAEHFCSEITGVFLPHLIDYNKHFGKGNGITELIKSSLAPSVREELVHFLLYKNIFLEEDLTEICSDGGYSLKKLLI